MEFNKGREFVKGLRAGVPIGLGYFAVAFSLGISAKQAGLSAFQGFLASFLGHASAGEYAVFTLIAANATYLELVLVTLITNARYLLMSCAMSQRAHPQLSLPHRLLMSYFITDEIFAVTIAQPGDLSPFFLYGAACVASPGWTVGTALGVVAGNALPPSIVSALSVALYGMFLAIIIPPAKKELSVALCVAAGFLCSWGFGVLPALGDLSPGLRTILLTLGLSALAALLFPRKEETDAE